MTVTKAHLTRQASDHEVPAKTVERDYVLAHVVAAVAACDGEGTLVFKGGTSLRLLHFDEYRYSADLDYSVVTGGEAAARELIQRALVRAQEAENAISSLTLTTDDPPRIAYVGPLGGKEKTLKVDMTDDELVVHTSSRFPLLGLWPDLPSVGVLAYPLQEVASEKLRCILQRLQCRDLFDLSHLLVHDSVTLDEVGELFARKARHRGFDPEQFSAKYQARLREYERRWEDELAEHVPGGAPHFDETVRLVTRALKKAGLL